MIDPLSHLFSIAAVMTLVAANGFFVAVEFAMVRIRETKANSPEFLQKFGAKSALYLVKDMDNSISAAQLGITVASLVLGWYGETTFHNILVGTVQWIGEPWHLIVSHGVATAFALVIVTWLHVVLGELVAKSLAIRHPESVLRVLAPTMLVFCRLCKPFVFFLNGTANLILQICRLGGLANEEDAHSTAELAMIISQSTESGVLDKDEEQMIKGVFEFSKTVAREVMTPRTDLLTLRYDSSFEEVLAVVGESGFSRIPIVGSGVDDIVGVLLVKELLPQLKQLAEDSSGFELSQYAREPYFIPGTKPIDDLLREFKTRKVHLAIVLDEHGGVDGLVTLEDILEEIVGDIYDESDVPERDIVIRESGDIFVDGGMLVADLNSRFGIHIPEGDYDTVAGFVFSTLGRIPSVGDEIQLGERGILTSGEVDTADEAESTNGHPLPVERARITVQRVRGNRIASVKLQVFGSSTESVESTHRVASSEAQEGLSTQESKSSS